MQRKESERSLNSIFNSPKKATKIKTNSRHSKKAIPVMRDEDSFLTERVEKNYTEEPPEIVVLPSARETSNSKIKRGTK